MDIIGGNIELFAGAAIASPTEVMQPNQLGALAWYKTWARGNTSALAENFTLAAVALSGTVTIVAGTNTISGSGTSFLSLVGRRIRVGGQDRFILSASTNTSAVINTTFENEGNWSSSATSSAWSVLNVATWKDSSGNGYDLTGTLSPPLFIDSDNVVYVGSTGTSYLINNSTPLVGATNVNAIGAFYLPAYSSTLTTFFGFGADATEAGANPVAFGMLGGNTGQMVSYWNYSDSTLNNVPTGGKFFIRLGQQGTNRVLVVKSTRYINGTYAALNFQGNRIGLLRSPALAAHPASPAGTRAYDFAFFKTTISTEQQNAIRNYQILRYKIEG